MVSRTVLITGCSSGIGLSAAVVLAKQPDAKFKVYATMRNTAKKEDLEKEGRDCLDKTLFIRALDVNDVNTFKPVLDEIIKSDGKLDILINNAGIGMHAISETVPVEGVRQVFDTNVIGLFQLTQAVIPLMKKQKSGHIINVTSFCGFVGIPYYPIYCASKFAVEGMTESLACELVADNIRFSLIEPGPVITKFQENKQTATGVDSPDVDEDTKQRFVYATMRNTAKKEDLEKEGRDCIDKTLFIRALDVKDVNTFKPVLDEIITSDGKLDILINNAGLGMLAISETVPVEDVRHVFDTNVIGLFQLTQAVIPLMKKQKSGHIINVTSLGGIIGMPYSTMYCASKFAVEGMTECLASELMADNIRFSLIEPGSVATKFRENLQTASGTGLDSPDVDEDAKQRFVTVLTKLRGVFSKSSQTAGEIGDVILKAATDENPCLRYQTSDYGEQTAKFVLADPTGNNYLARYSALIE